MANINIADAKKKDFYVLSDSEGNIIKLIFPNKVQFGLDDSRLASETTFATDLIPDKDKARSLGTADRQWKDIYVSKGTVYIDNAEINLTNSGKVRVKDADGTEHVIADLVNNSSIDEVKRWIGSQNTSSTRWGTSLIPNSNFSIKEYILNSDVSSPYWYEKPAGVLTIGVDEERISNIEDGICSFDATGNAGVLLSAIPLETSSGSDVVPKRYAIRVRVWGDYAETAERTNTSEGLFVAIMETSDSDIGDSTHIYDMTNPSVNYHVNNTYPVYTTNVTMNLLTQTTTDSGGNTDGDTIPLVNEAGGTPDVKSYIYTPTPGTKNISLAIWAKNYDHGVDNNFIHLDYCIMNEIETLTSDISDLVNTAVQSIDLEDTKSLVDGAGMSSKDKFTAIGNAILSDNQNGGDANTTASPDHAVNVTCLSPGDGILTKSMGVSGTAYTVGARIKLLNNGETSNISILASESHSLDSQSSGTGVGNPIINPNNIVTIQLVEFNSNNSPTGENLESINIDNNWVTLLGTYKVAGGVSGTSTYPDNLATNNVQAFSIAITADSACTMVIDYIYVYPQTVSKDIAEEYANAAYAGAEGYVTAMNELLIKEQGSLISNASMALYDAAGKPVGYSVQNADLDLVTDENNDKQIQVIQDDTSSPVRLLTPTWVLGDSDKYSIGVRIKSLNGGQNINLYVNYVNEYLSETPGAVNVIDPITFPGNFSQGIGQTAQIMTTAGGSDQLDGDGDSNNGLTSWAITNDYTSLLATWNRLTNASSARVASIVIEGDTSFEVDYVLVKEQTVSFDLAEATAELKAGEAFEALVNELEKINEDLNSETSSLIANAGFMSYLVKDISQTSTPAYIQHPKKWIGTRHADNLRRIVAASEASSYTDPFDQAITTTPMGQLVASLGQDDACVRLGSTTNSSDCGILSEAWQIPPQAKNSYTDENGDDQIASSSGKYIISIQARTAGSIFPVSIYAIESTTALDPNQKFVYTSNDHSDPVVNSSLVYESGTSTQIQLVNLSVLGEDTAGNSENVGNSWKNIGGTYTPSSNAKYVSFEIVFTPTTTTDHLYIDYVYLSPQMIGEEFITAYTTARLAALDTVSSSELAALETTITTALGNYAQYTDLTDLYTDLMNESQSLIPNGNFEQYYTVNSTTYAKYWSRYVNNTSYPADTKVSLYTTPADGSNGSYIKLGDGTRELDRIVSKSIINPMSKITQSDGSITAFNFAMRVRGAYLPATPGDDEKNFSFTVYVYEYAGLSPVSESRVIANVTPLTLDTNIPLTTYTTSQYKTLTLKDLGYSNSSSGPTVTIDDGVQDSGEDVNDWRVIVGSYVPTNELVTACSFHIYSNFDPDNDNSLQEVWIDAVTLDVASVSIDLATELAQTEADDAILVSKSKNFGGNLIENGRFDIATGVRNSRYPDDWSIKTGTSKTLLETLQFPVGTYSTANFHSSNSNTASIDYLISRPVRITEEDYDIIISCDAYKNAGSGNLSISVYMYETSTQIDPESISAIWLASNGTTYMQLTGNGAYQAATSSITLVSSINIAHSSGWQKLQYTYTPTAGVNWSSLVIKMTNGANINDYLKLRLVSCKPDTKTTNSQLVNRGRVTASGLNLGEFAGKTIAGLAADSNFTNSFGAKSVVSDHSITLGIHDDRLENFRNSGRGTGKSKSGVLDNGKMLITEDLDTTGLSPRLQPAGWVTSRTSYARSGISYEDSSNKVAVLYDASDSTIGMTSPAFEVIEDAYIVKVRCKFGGDGSTAYPYIYFWYTTSEELTGEYVTTQTIYPTESRHTTNTLSKYRTWTGISGDTELTLISSSTGNNTTALSTSYQTKTFKWVPPSAAKWASFEIYKNDVDSLYVDWIVVSPDTKTARVDSLSPFLNKTLEAAYLQGKIDRNNTLLALGPSSGRTNLDYTALFGFGQDWMLATSPNFSFLNTNYSSRISFQLKTDVNTVATQAYIQSSNVVPLNFTGQHRCEDHNDELSKSGVGLIVVSTGVYNNLIEEQKPTINESLPVVTLSSKRNQKSCFGVLSDKEDRNGEPREYSVGNFVSVHADNDPLNRLIINSLGEGAIWVCNINGDLENGDYITSCEIPGHGMRQDDDLLHNYTVAKITQDCTFELDNPRYDCVEFEFEGKTYRKAFVGCTYHCG